MSRELSRVLGGLVAISIYQVTPSIQPFPNPPPATCTNRPSSQGYAYSGCYSDTNVRAPALQGAATAAASVDACVAFCGQGGFDLAGIGGTYCQCGNAITCPNVRESDNDCNTVCEANNSFCCGGTNRMGVYNNTVSASTAPTTTSLRPRRPMPQVPQKAAQRLQLRLLLQIAQVPVRLTVPQRVLIALPPRAAITQPRPLGLQRRSSQP